MPEEQTQLDFNDPAMVGFIAAVNEALIASGDHRYEWLKEHPLRYEEANGAAYILTGHPSGEAWSYSSKIDRPHEVLRQIADLIDKKEATR